MSSFKRKQRPGLNFRNDSMNGESLRGTKPVPRPSSVFDILMGVVQYLCRQFIFIEIRYRLFYYLALTFLVSVVTDLVPPPRSMVSRKDSFLNLYFVKLGWGWTLLLSIPFVGLTSFVYNCGEQRRVIQHFSRLAIATAIWSSCIALFTYVEKVVGRCNVKDWSLNIKSTCLAKGYVWTGIDVSGHCFLLVYSSLVLIEECRVMNNWEGIADLIREEGHARNSDGSQNAGPLKSLDDKAFTHLSTSYPKLTPTVRLVFLGITILLLIWDFMLVVTVFFYHSMVEKMLAVFVAIAAWYSTYRLIFGIVPFIPTPGDGLFRYMKQEHQHHPLSRISTQKWKNQRSSWSSKMPTFMGMPLRTANDASGSSS